MFGTNNNNNTGFGASTSGSATFGNQSGATSGFGASAKRSASFGGSGGMFGNSSPTNTTTPSNGGLFGTSTPAASGGMFGTQASQPSFVNNSTPQQTPQQSTGMFGNNKRTGGMFGAASTNNNTNNSGGLFGTSNNSTALPASAGLFGNNAPTNNASGSGLFGNNANISSPGGLFGNSQQQGAQQPFNTVQYGTPVKHYNFKDLPKSLTDSTKTNKTIHHPGASRKRSLSGSVPVIQQGRASLMERFGSRFSNLQSQATYNSEGLFSPKKDFVESVFRAEIMPEPSVALNKVPHRPLVSNGFSSRSTRAPRVATTEYLKLRVDPARTEARRLKIFGESGGAKKVRILGREDDESLLPSNGHQEAPQESPEQENIELDFDDDDIPKEQETDYWCSPTIDELQTLPLRQLAEVPGFTIGRKGLGVIRFDLPVDLTAFWSDLKSHLFDNVVKINKNHTVEVYPNGSVPLGTGLNVPATITLEKVFPVARGKNPHTGNKDLETRLFVKKLNDLKGMEFVTYDPFNGSWTFKVKHFSVWGLVDEDDAVVDVDEEFTRLKRQSPGPGLPEPHTQPNGILQNAAKTQPKVVKTNNFAEDTFLYKKQRDDHTYEHDTTSFIPGSFAAPEVYVEEEDILIPNTDNILSDIDIDEPMDASVPSQFPTAGDESLSEDFNERQFEPETVDEHDFNVLDANPNLNVSDDWDQQLDLSDRYDSVFANKDLKQTTIFEGPFSKGLTAGELDKLLYGDFSEVLRSNKAINKELRIEHYNFTSFTNSSRVLKKTSKTASHVSAVSLTPFYGSENDQFFKAVYQNHLACSTITARSNGFPRVNPNKDLSFKLIIDRLGYDFSKKESSIWELASVLFDNTINEELRDVQDMEVVNRVLEIQRREGLISWIKKEIQSEIDLKLDNTSDVFEQIFLLLSSFNIASAAKLAIKSNNLHLSVLISLLGSNDPDVKYSAGKQLETWKSEGLLKGIPEPLVKIYYLLKGDVLAPITEGVSWKTKLGLLLSYGDLNESLATLLGSFVDSENDVLPRSDSTYFNMLKLFVLKHNSSYALPEILSSLKTDGVLDVRLQWYVYEILVRSTKQLSPGSNSHDLGDRLTLLFSEQLQSLDLWEEALFVLSHLHSEHSCATSISRLISRNTSLLVDDELCMRLEKLLHVPSDVISECKALYYRYKGDHWREAEHIFAAGKFSEAHRVIVTHVAPAAVINNGSKLKKLDSLISKFPDQKPSEWGNGLGVYKNYIKLVSSKTISQGALRYLVETIPLMKASNFHMNVAIKLMAGYAAKSLALLQSNEGTGVLDLDVVKAGKLPLGESEKLVVLMLDRFLKKEALSY